ncbi:hypothetical protein DRJ00_07325, partial [Candidatus Aerophobetes bacterium]
MNLKKTSLIFALALSLGIIVNKSQGGENMAKLKGKKAVMVIAEKNFRDEELFEPKKILEAEGVKVIVASTSFNIARGMLG